MDVPVIQRERAPEPPIDLESLSLYFRDMSQFDVMTPAQERNAAQGIRGARGLYWAAILAYAPFVEGIVKVISAALELEPDTIEILEALRTASRRFRDRQTRAHNEAFEAAVAVAAHELSRIDTDGAASEPIAADIQAIADGQRPSPSLEVTLPPTGSGPYRRYATKVANAGSALMLAKADFVRANLRLVVTMARRYGRSGTTGHARLPLPDLIQEGNIGLLKAVDRFDPDRGFRFSTYASWWIRHAISRALADKGRAVRVPVHMIDAHHKVRRAKQKFEQKNGRPPTDVELSDAAGVPTDKIERLRDSLLDAGPSLDSPVSNAEGRTLGDLLPDNSLPAAPEALQTQAVTGKVNELMLTSLRPFEADVLRKRFGLGEYEPMTLREIGDQYSLSRERIRQVQERALTKIRRELRRQDLY